jgi:hypothetical protein
MKLLARCLILTILHVAPSPLSRPELLLLLMLLPPMLVNPPVAVAVVVAVPGVLQLGLLQRHLLVVRLLQLQPHPLEVQQQQQAAHVSPPCGRVHDGSPEHTIKISWRRPGVRIRTHQIGSSGGRLLREYY